jgi:hypothetical protein
MFNFRLDDVRVFADVKLPIPGAFQIFLSHQSHRVFSLFGRRQALTTVESVHNFLLQEVRAQLHYAACIAQTAPSFLTYAEVPFR